MAKSKTSNFTSKRMSAIKGYNTKVELLLRKRLWGYGFRYRIKSKLIGKPDIVFNSRKLVIFVDGDFWHGYDLKRVRKITFNNKTFWINKIEKNIKRDKEVNKALINDGYVVIRIWEHELKKDLDLCVKKVIKHLSIRNSKSGKLIMS